MEKKCPHCGEWTPWQQKPTDKCAHCHAYLDQRALEEKATWLARQEGYKKTDFFTPKEDDGPLMLVTRKVAFVFHLIFGAISWLFIVTFASGPG